MRFDAAIRDLTERYARLEPYEDESHALATGDACMVNMVGYMATADGGKGEPLPEAASGDNVEVILGSGRYMTGLVEGLEGGKVGETKTVNVRFPDVSLYVFFSLRGVRTLMRCVMFHGPLDLAISDIIC